MIPWTMGSARSSPANSADHREAVGGGGDRVAPTVLGARRPMGDRLPNDFGRVGVGLQETDDVAADLSDVVALDAT